MDTIVVVDDDPDIVSLLQRTLESSYRVLPATSGVEALGLCGSNEVVMVLTDQKMPGMTGVQLARAIHREDQALSVVLLTAYTEPQDVIAAINEGEVFRFVSKPWNISDLLLTIKSAIERTKLARENRHLVKALNRQISAISLVSGVGRDVGVSGTAFDVFAHLLRRLPGIIDFDLGAALIEEAAADVNGKERRLLHIECNAGVDEGGLVRARDRTVELFREAAGRTDDAEVELVVRVAGGQQTSNVALSEPEALEELFVPVTAHSGQMGLIVLWSSSGRSYTAEDARLLDVLASETAVLLKQQLEAVDGERRHFHDIMSSLVDGVIVTRTDGAIASINAAARGQLGLFPDVAIDTQALWKMLGLSPRDAIEQFEMRGPAPLRFQTEVLGRTLVGAASPVFDQKRRLQQVAFTLRDVSEERTVERAKDEMVATLSHELRSPLAAIRAALDLAIEQHGKDLPGAARRYVETARDSSDRLRALVDDVLDMARQQAGELAVRMAPVDLVPTIERVVAQLEPQAQKFSVRIVFERDAGALGAHADEGRVAQVLTNLISNALKFASSGSEVRVRASVTQTSPAFVIASVWNEGPVIPRNEFARIFKRFEQGSTAALTKQRGSGLGLSISASLVEAHDGFIWLDSREGQGTSFSFAIPAERLRDENRAALRPTEESTLEGMRVLAIDDDVALGELLRGLLSRFGIEVEVATDGGEALSLARRIPFDAILTDVRMSQVDGLMLTETLKHDPVTRHVPVIVFSVVDQSEAARRAGAVSFMSKPIDVFALLERLRRLKELRTKGDMPVVLLVEKEESVRKTMAQVLANLSLRVLEVERFGDARLALDARRVDMMLVGTQLADGDGISAVEQWRREHASSDVIVLFVADHDDTQTKVRAFRAGGDDYLVKPLETLELAARIDSALRRREREVAASPTTRLPGSIAIEREVQTRVDAGEAFTLCYFDIDHLKAFNDVYGYAKTDAVILQTGDILREAVSRVGEARDFVGHIAGDDFVCVFSDKNAEKICRLVLETFDKIIPLYYDTDDRKRGYIEADDRYGSRRQFPVMSISVAAVGVAPASGTTYAHLSARATELKKRAKAIPGSAIVVAGHDGELRELRTDAQR